MILTELFFLVVYLSLVGGLFGVVSLLLSRVLKRALPLWFSLCGLTLYGIPVLSPQVRLFSPQPEQRLPAFHMAALVWAVGCLLFLAYRVTRLLLAGKSPRRRPVRTSGSWASPPSAPNPWEGSAPRPCWKRPWTRPSPWRGRCARCCWWMPPPSPC